MDISDGMYNSVAGSSLWMLSLSKTNSVFSFTSVLGRFQLSWAAEVCRFTYKIITKFAHLESWFLLLL